MVPRVPRVLLGPQVAPQVLRVRAALLALRATQVAQDPQVQVPQDPREGVYSPPATAP